MAAQKWYGGGGGTALLFFSSSEFPPTSDGYEVEMVVVGGGAVERMNPEGRNWKDRISSCRQQVNHARLHSDQMQA